MLPTRRNSRLGRVRVARSRYSFSPPISSSLHRPPGALGLNALAGYPAQKEFKARLRSQRKKETDPKWSVSFLAEKERFELSRRVYPTYTLSRGASSANLSTSPCSNQGFIPCGSPFFKSALLLYPILLLLSISFFTFPLFIFDFSALALEIILRVCYNYPNGL